MYGLINRSGFDFKPITTVIWEKNEVELDLLDLSMLKENYSGEELKSRLLDLITPQIERRVNKRLTWGLKGIFNQRCEIKIDDSKAIINLVANIDDTIVRISQEINLSRPEKRVYISRVTGEIIVKDLINDIYSELYRNIEVEINIKPEDLKSIIYGLYSSGKFIHMLPYSNYIDVEIDLFNNEDVINETLSILKKEIKELYIHLFKDIFNLVEKILEGYKEINEISSKIADKELKY